MFSKLTWWRISTMMRRITIRRVTISRVIVRLRPSHTGMMIMMIRRSAVLLVIMMVIAGGWTIRLEIVVFRVGSAHMHTYTFYNVTLAAQRPSHFGLYERHKTERPERLRYVDVNDLAVFGEVFLQVLGGERFREPSHEYLSTCLRLLLLYKIDWKTFHDVLGWPKNYIYFLRPDVH